MTIQEMVEIVQRDGIGWLFIIVVMLSLIQISPIKINPWSKLRESIANFINKDTNQKIVNLEQDMGQLKTNVTEIQTESHDQRIDALRIVIINAARELKKLEGKELDAIDIEYLSQINRKCDTYEKLCEEYNITNGVAKMSIAYIREFYNKAIYKL